MQAAWFVGVDWGSQKHQVCVTDAAGAVLGERAFEHGGAGLSEMADWLLSFAAGAAGDVGVAIETPRGPVVESLMEHGIAVHSINPKQLDRFRDRLSPAGAKDDRRDAQVLASALRTDPHCFRRLEPTDPTIVELREWSRLSEELTRERVRLANRMHQQLWRYYPQFLDAVDGDVAAPWALDLWRSLPTPRAGQRVREVTLTRVWKQHRIRRTDAATLRGKLRAPAVKVAPGAVEAAVTHVELVAGRVGWLSRRRWLGLRRRVPVRPADGSDGSLDSRVESGNGRGNGRGETVRLRDGLPPGISRFVAIQDLRPKLVPATAAANDELRNWRRRVGAGDTVIASATSPIRRLGATIARCSTWPNAQAIGSWSSATTTATSRRCVELVSRRPAGPRCAPPIRRWC